MDWLASHDKEIVALGTITLAAFTVVLAFATTFLYLATKNLVEGADRNAAKQLRAYVFIAGGQVILDEANGRISASISLKNFGQTPGYEFKTWTGIRIARSDEGTFGEPGH